MRRKITKTTLVDLKRGNPNDGKTLLVYDTEVRGFGARISPARIAFFVEYRIGGRGGRNRRMTLGSLGELTVEEARRKAQRMRVDITDGIDVLQKRNEARAKMTGIRFDEAVEKYLGLNAQDGRYWTEVRRLLTSKDLAAIAKRPIGTLKPFEVVAIIDNVTPRSPATARALFAALRPFFAWCMPRGLITASPLAGIKPPPPVAARDRILAEHEIQAFWSATEELGFPFSQIFRLLLLTGQRRAEAAGLRWSEVDLTAATWTLSGARTKNGKLHVVDLAPPAITILRELPRGSNDLVFTTTGKTAPSGFSRAKARLDALMTANLGSDLPPWRAHDLRRTAASGMAAEGVPPHIVERVLNHLSGAQGGLVGIYQRHDYRQERREALCAWAETIEEIVSAQPDQSNVVDFRVCTSGRHP